MLDPVLEEPVPHRPEQSDYTFERLNQEGRRFDEPLDEKIGLLAEERFHQGKGALYSDEDNEFDLTDDESYKSDPETDPIYQKQDICSVILEILKVAVPAMLSAMTGQITYLINMVQAGQLSSPEKLAGIGLGHSVTQALGIMIFLGLNSALATQLSQAYGHGRLKLCGQYVNRAHIQNMLICVPIGLILGNMWYFFKLIGQPEQVSEVAARFIWASLPHILFTQMFDVYKHQLNCFRLSYLQMMAQVSGTLAHIPIMFYILEKLPEDPILAIGLATSVSSLLKLVLIILLGYCAEEVRESKVSFWTTMSVSGLEKDSEFFSISLPSMVMFCAEGWAFQILTLMAGFISVEDQAVQSICALLSTTLFMFGSGLQEASSSLIGNMIGAQKVGFAWHYAQVMSAMSIVFTVACQIPLFIYMEQIADLFTNDADVKRLLLQVLPVVYICFFFEAVQCQRQGVIRGLNLQKSAAWLTLICYYAIAVPVGAAFAFKYGKGVEGLRAGVLVGQLVLVTLYSILIDCLTNWQKEADKTQDRLYQANKNFKANYDYLEQADLDLETNIPKRIPTDPQDFGFRPSTPPNNPRYSQQLREYWSEPETGQTGSQRREVRFTIPEQVA